MRPLLLLLASYLLGAVPSSYIAGRLVRGIDLRQHGSGNLGATNVFRVLGVGVAIPVMVIDVLKGWVPVALFPIWHGGAGGVWPLAYGAAAIVGHGFSPYVGFRGGKGIATAAGVFLALAPVAVLTGLVVFAVLVYATRIVSVASLSAAIALPLMVYLTLGAGPVLWLALGVTSFVFYTHRSNLRRLRRGEEPRIRPAAGGRS
jgi:acyl phosphate:glycerol-3-phosphate acyltransferase